MRVFVTGGSGFLGSYLVADLLEGGHEVAVLFRSTLASSWRLRPCGDHVVEIRGTLDDIPALRPALERFRPQAVAHLAWRGVGGSERNSPSQARNVSDAAELATLAADIGAEAFVGAGSQAEYGPYDRAISPNDATRPTTLYGIAKLSAAWMTDRIAQERGMRFAWLRVFSTYGAKDAEYWLIPSFIKALAKGEKISLTGCQQRWGFLHARDAASAFRIVLTQGDAKGFFNLGDPEAPLLRDTLIKLRDLINPDANLGFGDIPYRPDQVMVLQADTQRLNALGWTPKVALSDGLRETVAWYVDSQRT
jgi:nucleoside-diphosphate-sugar epimerase